jgi:hypothetical protein|tara:strand:+ start:1664 stop:1873 length:210 start_codon:yes stop_codon:yes gene_type:complete
MYSIENIVDRAFKNLDLMLGVSRRARDDDGTYKADDASTPNVNEAWTSGKSPKKKRATKKKKVSENYEI